MCIRDSFNGGVAWQPYERFFGGHSVIRSLIPEGNEGSGIIGKMCIRDSWRIVRASCS